LENSIANIRWQVEYRQSTDHTTDLRRLVTGVLDVQEQFAGTTTDHLDLGKAELEPAGQMAIELHR